MTDNIVTSIKPLGFYRDTVDPFIFCVRHNYLYPAGSVAPDPAPNSWAAGPENETSVWTIKLEPDAECIIPPASAYAKRTLYFPRGKSLTTGNNHVSSGLSFRTRTDIPVSIRNGDSESELLLLQSRPINEPVVQHGPFVMNTEEEIRQAFTDYRANAFGGWPWPVYDNVHSRNSGRFARHADGKTETKTEPGLTGEFTT